MSSTISNPPDLIVEVSNDHRYDLETKTKSTKKCFDEFDDQSILLEECFSQEISSIVTKQNELIEEIQNEFSNFINDLLRQRLENVESLRLLHQKEIHSKDKNLSDCLEQQSIEMNELCQNLLVERQRIPMKFIERLIEFHRRTTNDLKESFQKKISYLNEIHSTTVEQLKSKHQENLDELQCELKLISEFRR